MKYAYRQYQVALVQRGSWSNNHLSAVHCVDVMDSYAELCALQSLYEAKLSDMNDCDKAIWRGADHE